MAPQLWDAARFFVSHQGVPGQLIFTGSAVPPDLSLIKHSGTRRFAWITMRPMSLWESGDSNGKVSLSAIFSNQFQPAQAPETSLEKIAYLVCRGGWPASLSLSRRGSLLQARDYVDDVVNSDISRMDNVNRDAEFAHNLLRSYSRHQGQQASISTIFSDLSSKSDNVMSEETIASYILALKKIFVIEDLEAWNPNLRSKTAIRTSDTRYFVDPSIATAALGIGPQDLMTDLKTYGLLFETMAVRDLRIYADALDGKVYHYRDKSGLERDAVLHRKNGIRSHQDP